jgi:DNA mismatch repair protein MutS2
MDKHTLQILEFNKILEMAAAFAVTSPGRAKVSSTGPLNDTGEIAHKSSIIAECRTLLSEGSSSGIEHFDELRPLLKKIKPEDAILDPFELRSFLPLFYSALNLKNFENNPACAGLANIISEIKTHPDIKDTIERSIDYEGKIRDKASRELAVIRTRISSDENRIKVTLDRILKQKELAPHLQDFFVAERNNRLVIPVKIDSKGSVPGILHDISNTGETVYIEPYPVQQLGNEIESLRAEEKLEEYRILKAISSLIKGKRSEISEDYYIVAGVDELWAIARFSEQMKMSLPEINLKGLLKINNGRHPLLWKTLIREKREKDLVPLDIEMGRGHSCIVITGSNAGGKTVALKTIGAINLMALSGMHVPADSGTTIPLLENIFADIGDEQSIENNLSTFSAHINRISEIVRQSGNNTLIMIDELGTGTDPDQGGALSCAILRKLKEKGALTVVSTHLSTLKAFAHSEPGLINSSMEMEEITLDGISTFKPTYKLVIGEPGTSHAFEIAESLGLHKDIINDARQGLVGEGARIESLIRDLKHQKREIDNRLKEAEEFRHDAEQEKQRLKEEIADLRSKKQNVLAKALANAEEVLRKTKTEAHEIIKKLKKVKPTETAAVIKDLDKKHKEIKKELKAHTPEKVIAVKEVTTGQLVYVAALGVHGTVSFVNNRTKKCKVTAGGKEIMIPFTGLSEPLKGEGRAPLKKDNTKRSYTVDT